MPGSMSGIEKLTVPERVVLAVAEANDVSPMEVSPPLYETVDPDALESLIEQTSDRSFQVSFEFHGCHVTVHGNGDVAASNPADAEQSVTVTSAATDDLMVSAD
ncbi:HalOD1 output domain-containing protein [Natronomonas sp.]|uniref:HalOD1 output domain-containing protein n=1 Tax=Natronomonas sp. TaxID=2184060 RepID=UPI002FC3DEB2